MSAAGFAPPDLYKAAERALDSGSPIGLRWPALRRQIEEQEKETGLKIPVDVEGADYLVILSSIEIIGFAETIGALRGIFARMVPRREFRRGGKLGVIGGYFYHLGLAAIVFGYLPHILFVERLTGVAWPPLPAALVCLAVGLSAIGLLMALLERLTDPVLRLLSGFDDYFS
jgi:hypothetical protein